MVLITPVYAATSAFAWINLFPPTLQPIPCRPCSKGGRCLGVKAREGEAGQEGKKKSSEIGIWGS